MVLKAVAAGILVGIAAKIRQDEQRCVAGVFGLALHSLPKLRTKAIGAPDAINVERVGTGVRDIDVVHGDPEQTGRLLLHQAAAQYTSRARRGWTR